MGACCGGMKTGQHKSLPENQQTNNVDEKDKCVNGPQGDAAVAKETPVTVDQQQQQPVDQEASANHTSDHAQPSTASPEEVELKITEPERSESEPMPAAACPVAEKPDVCPEEPAAPSAAQPTPIDSEKEQNKPSTEVLFVSEDSDIVRPKDEVMLDVTTTTTTRVEHTQKSCTTETTEVRTTTVVDETLMSTVSTSVDKVEDQQEVADVEQLKPCEDVVASTSVEAPAVVDEADHAPAAITGASNDQQNQADTDVVAEAAAAEDVLAASSVDQQESVPPPPAEQTDKVHDDTVLNDETVTSTDTAPTPSEQPDVQQSIQTAPEASEVVDAPSATASVEPGVEDAKHELTSVETDEQPVLPQSTDDVEATTEQSAPAQIADVETLDVHAEAPLEADVPAEVTPGAHEEPHPAVEEMEQSRDVEATNTEGMPSTDAVQPVVDDSATKPEETVSSSVTQDEVGSTQPEELPPPLTPEKNDAPAPANEEAQQAPSTACYVAPITDTVEQPKQPAVNGVIDSVEEPTSKSTSEAADHAGDMLVEGEP